MKYIFINDIFNFLKNKAKLIFLFLVFYISILIFYKVVYKIELSSEICDILGINYSSNFERGLLPNLLFIFNIFVNIYICMYLFTYDINNNLENIFLRITQKKWLIYKMISIVLISAFIRVIIFFIAFILFKGDVIFYFKVFALYNIFIFVIQLFFLFIYIVISKSKLYLLIFIGLLLISLKFLDWDISVMNNIFFYLIFLIFILLYLIMSIFKYNYCKVFEGERC